MIGRKGKKIKNPIFDADLLKQTLIKFVPTEEMFDYKDDDIIDITEYNEWKYLPIEWFKDKTKPTDEKWYKNNIRKLFTKYAKRT